MPMEIYSICDPSKLLHGFYTKSELSLEAAERIDLSENRNPLQIAILNVKEVKRFQPHFHLNKEIPLHFSRAQECWVVVQGLVQVSYFDTDNSLICDATLGVGDISYTFEGGHGYEILSANTLVYEFKSGPYLGVTADKKMIDFKLGD
jgi:hypothetical protein